ncbi:MAG: hypothetical protein WED00_19040 [Aquisalimonadaceae bacterium]
MSLNTLWGRLAVCFVLIAAAWSSGALAGPPIEEAIELARVELVDGAPGQVTVHKLTCPRCEAQTFELDEGLQLFANGREVSRDYLRTSVSRSATVIYRLKTKRIVKVLW